VTQLSIVFPEGTTDAVRSSSPLSGRRHRAGPYSGGERQRIAIACTLAAEPGILVCDEITSGLDTTVAAEIVELLDSSGTGQRSEGGRVRAGRRA
jgi:ABC-type glutathione transport system ATPase component